MALILHRREIVTSQPKESFEIDWSNPITRGLVFAFTPNSDRNLVDGLAPFYTSGTAKKDAGIELGLTSTAYSAVWKVPAFTNNCSLLLRASAIQTGGHLSAVSSTAVESGHFLSYEASNWNMFSEGGNGYPCAKRADPFGTAQGLRTVIGVNTDRSLRDIYVNGLKGSTSTLTQPNTLMNQVGFGFIDRTTYFTTPLTKCYNQAAIWNRALSEAEIKSLSDNPWQIFAPRETRLFVPVGGGGTTTVTSDSAASYKIQGSVQSSVTASYGIRSAIQASAVASYAIRTVAQKDAASAYSIRGATQQSSALAYAIRGLVDQAIAASYAVRSAVSSDASATYNILSATSVSASASAGYSIRGSIQQSSAVAYLIRGLVDQVIAASYAVRGAVSSDASATYNILSASSVSASTSAGYNIRGSINQDTAASYSLRGSVAQDTSATYSILSATSVSSSVTAGYAIKGSVQSSIVAGYSIDYASSGFIRAPAGSGPTVIQPGSYRLSQSATSRPSNTGGRRY